MCLASSLLASLYHMGLLAKGSQDAFQSFTSIRTWHQQSAPHDIRLLPFWEAHVCQDATWDTVLVIFGFVGGKVDGWVTLTLTFRVTGKAVASMISIPICMHIPYLALFVTVWSCPSIYRFQGFLENQRSRHPFHMRRQGPINVGA
jgi:hypothetical protein